MEVPEGRKSFFSQKITLIKSLKRTAFFSLYPKRCPLCNKALSMSEYVCQDCEHKLPFVTGPTCYCCGKPVSSAEQEFCYDCRYFPKSFQAGLALFLYNETSRPLIADFKYHNKRILSDFFVYEMIKHHKEELLSRNIDLIVPIPVHKNKRKSRGYNQAELLAKGLSKSLSIPCLPDLLIRTIDTLPQKYFSAQSRHYNLLKAFSINRKYDLSNLDTILLIDDIYTTGATMEACTKILKAEGVKNIYTYSVCIGLARD